MKCAQSLLVGLLVLDWQAGPVVAQEQAKHLDRNRIDLRPTFRHPGANGRVRIQRATGGLRISVDIDDLKPAALFGGDYNIYVLWAVLPDGEAENLGELKLDGDRSRKTAGLRRGSVRILITAEPHWLVASPSSFVILEDPALEGVALNVAPRRYYYERDTVADAKEAEVPVRTDVQQAWTAVQLAQRTGAAEHAKVEFAKAEQALDATLELAKQGSDPRAVDRQARETVRLAVAAQNRAELRAAESGPLSETKF
jgi:hypothetical protein